MQITKREALSLIKVLSHYDSLMSYDKHYPVVDNIHDLIQDFEEFILSEDEPYGVKTFSDSMKVDSDIEPNVLCNLQKVRGHVNNSSVGESGDDVVLSFKKVINETGEVDTFLMVGKDVVGPITYLAVHDRELQVATGQGQDRLWHYFDIEQTSQDWMNVFGNKNYVYRVINWV